MKKVFVFFLASFIPAILFAQSWQYTTAMNSVRWLSEMVVLDNQTALIVGGYNENGEPLSSCEIYDPATATWSLTGSLHVARVYPTIVKLSNGHVISLCGGTQFGVGTATDVVEDFDPSTGSWAVVGKLQKARYVPCATLLQDGRILISGGLVQGGMTATCEIYDPITNVSKLTGQMQVSRYCAQAVLINDGKVLITGGRDGGSVSNYYGECELYDPIAESWSLASSMNQSRTMGVLTHFSDNSVLAAGGRNTSNSLATGSEILDPLTNLWQNTSPIHEPIHWTAGIAFPDDRFMATGGMVDGEWSDPSGLAVISTPQCEWYDRNLQQWYFAPQLNYSRCRHDAVYIHQTTSTALPTEFLLVAGGQKGNGSRDSAGLHLHSDDFTNSAEILDVTKPALLSYMKMPINAGTASVPYQNGRTTVNFIDEADGSINIDISLQTDARVETKILSMNAQISKRVFDENLHSGVQRIHVATTDLPSGAYLLELKSNGIPYLFKFLVVK
ncbi:MAG: kelch repeat-containing protein [bacterium]